MPESFNPREHLIRLKGGEYLEVKWRLAWYRSEHPDGQIETELMQFDSKLAVFRARVSLPSGGSATGWGSETPGDFPDFLEKAETKALGRALAALGYGTQFTADFELGGTLADAPVDLGRQAPLLSEESAGLEAGHRKLTAEQERAIRGLGKQLGATPAQLDKRARELYGRPGIRQLSRGDATDLIGRMQASVAAQAAKKPEANGKGIQHDEQTKGPGSPPDPVRTASEP